MAEPMGSQPLDLRLGDSPVQRLARGVSVIGFAFLSREDQIPFALRALEFPDLKLMDQFGRKGNGPAALFCLGWLEQERLTLVAIGKIKTDIELRGF